ncbi:histidine kinase N-terminal 7TM domain-containing protein [Halobaculum sp. EA56]|uniref:sensor histidine kinase n=1 Tax=Halobaculum sp. EA56 TaxID=3421648 RepID=UPI003EBDD447
MLPPSTVVWLLVAGGVGSLVVLGWVLYTRRLDLLSPEPAAFVVLSLGAAAWTWGYALQFAAGSLTAKTAFDGPLWLGIAAVGAAWPVFGLTVAGDDDLLTPRRTAVLVGVPVTAALIAWTNPVHGLMYAQVGLADPAVWRPLVVTPGPAFGAFVLYSYAVNGFVAWRLWCGTRDARGDARMRRGLVLAAGALPLVVGTVGLLSATPSATDPAVDYTPAMFAVTTMLTGVAVGRYGLLDPAAVARDLVVAGLSDPVVVVDGSGYVRAANRAGERLLGGRADTGVHVDEAFADHPALVTALREGDATRVQTSVRTLSPDGGSIETAEAAAGGPPDASGSTGTSGRTDSTGSTGGRADGDATRGRREERAYDVSVTPLADTDGGAVLVFRDVTDRLRAERRLTVLNRILRHDLRNDVNVIEGYLDLLRTAVSEAGLADAERYLDVAERRTADLVTLSDRARTVDDIATGDVSFTRVDVGAAAADRCEQVRREHGEGGVEVSYDPPDGPAFVEAMAVFPSVIDNLIENAVEHSDRERPRVEVSVSVTDDAVEFVVADDGPGIPAADRAVFERGDEAALEDASGLGLWLVNWVVTASGGRIAVADREPRGSVVTVTHPRAPPDPLLTGE